MKVSIIVPTYNEELSIKDCLESLSLQTLKDLEIIIVDDGSTDRTLEILLQIKTTNPNLKILKQDHKGPGLARNLGAEKAKGEVLVFVDADMTFDKKFIEELIKPIVEGKSKGTFSKEEMVSNKDNIWSQCWNINKNLPIYQMHGPNYPDTQKVFRAILKSEFKKVGGFESGGHYTDDWSLSEKLGYLAVVAEGAKFYHSNPSSLSEVFHQANWVAKRPYKLGIVGDLIALIRVSLPISIIIGIIKSLLNLNFNFLIFKIVFDLGSFLGILEYTFSGKGFK